jgi:dolichol-phosphate mannosyltransferase
MILLAIFLFLIGIQSILMGILADLQMRTFYESQGKRTYIVRQALGFRDK